MAGEIALASRVFVTEKLDGANMRVLVRRGEELQFGSRDKVLKSQEDKEHFFKGKPVAWWEVPEHKAAAYALLDYLGVDEVTIFGEIIGWGIQKRIRYLPDDDSVWFYAFDIWVNDSFLPYPQFLDACTAVGLPFAPLLYDGSPAGEQFSFLIEAVGKGELKSFLAHYLSGREVPAEGIVIRTEPLFITTLNSYSIAKLKSPQFEEVERGEEKPKVVSTTVTAGEDLINFLNTYVTEGRLHNVLVKLKGEGKVENDMKDLKHIIPAYWDDLKEECGQEIEQLLSKGIDEKSLKHRVSKKVQVMYINLLKKEAEAT